jgi:ABC-type branched-subunit amino acid transport system permease subunit
LGEYRFITYGILLVLVVLFMPEGLNKKLFREREMVES